MKTYVAPELTLMAFTADQSIAAAKTAEDSNHHNDVELAW